MGEYAKFNGKEIKIGTCESMYYLRWDHRGTVTPLEGNVDPAHDTGLFFRLPFPDEDEVLPGGYEDYRRGYRLGRKDAQDLYWHDWQPDDILDHDPGTIYLYHKESGLMLNVPCHHGAKLPDIGNAKAFWNGKRHALELAFVKSMPGGTLRPVYRCRFCEQMWSCEWDEILPYCGLDKAMLTRLEKYAELSAVTA